MNPQRGNSGGSNPGSSTGGTATAQGGSSGGLSSALTEAQSIIAAAEKRAEEIIRNAEQAREEAKQQGHAEGLVQGARQAEETAIRLVSDLGALKDQIAREAALLAIEVCRTLLGEQFSQDPNRVVELAKQALERSISTTSVTLIVNPGNLATIEANEELLRRSAAGATIRFEADPDLAPGGCVVRTDFGEVDVTIDALLDNLRERLGI